MIVSNINYKRLFLGVLTIALASCSNPWEDRKNNGDPNLDANLNEAIANTAEISKFKELLTKTGYDKTLSESKTYTVFAPTNEALAQVDPSILDTPEEVAFFVQNHIALTAFSSVRNGDVKIKMLSEKYLVFKGSTIIDDATIINADKYASNGVFHIVNKALSPKQNIWQYINGQAATSEMGKFLLSLKEKSIYESDDVAKAIAVPGIYADSLTNSFLKNVYNLNNEKNTYTLFLMDDAGYTAEVDKLKPYLIKSTADSTARYSSYFTTRDMVFPKAYKPTELPNSLTSRFGVTVPVDKTQIVGEPIILSNGIIYRMKKVDVKLDKRLVTTKIEGENLSTFYNGSRSKIFYRERKDPDNIPFNDVMMQNPGTSNFTLRYEGKDFYSTTYDVYWRAVNDVQTNVFQQTLRIYGKYKVESNFTTFYDPINIAFPYVNVPLNFYGDVYIGKFTLTKARDLNCINLVTANTTTNGNNTLTLDYLKFVPVLK